MAVNLTVENGTIVSGCNTYYSLASTDNYFNSRGDTVWIGYTDDERSYALIKSFHYMNNIDWQGMKSVRGQENAWPRIGMVDEDGYSIDSNIIPTRVKWGQAELAYRGLTESLEPDVSAGSNIKSEKVDVIEVVYTSSKSLNPIYQRVDSLLMPFIKYGGGSSCVIELVRG